MTISKHVYWPRTELGIYKYMDNATVELYSVFHISYNIYFNFRQASYNFVAIIYGGTCAPRNREGGEM